MNVIDWSALALETLSNITQQIIQFLNYDFDFSAIGLGRISILTLVSVSLVALLIYKIFRWLLF